MYVPLPMYVPCGFHSWFPHVYIYTGSEAVTFDFGGHMTIITNIILLKCFLIFHLLNKVSLYIASLLIYGLLDSLQFYTFTKNIVI